MQTFRGKTAAESDNQSATPCAQGRTASVFPSGPSVARSCGGPPTCESLCIGGKKDERWEGMRKPGDVYSSSVLCKTLAKWLGSNHALGSPPPFCAWIDGARHLRVTDDDDDADDDPRGEDPTPARPQVSCENYARWCLHTERGRSTTTQASHRAPEPEIGKRATEGSGRDPSDDPYAYDNNKKACEPLHQMGTAMIRPATGHLRLSFSSCGRGFMYTDDFDS